LSHNSDGTITMELDERFDELFGEDNKQDRTPKDISVTSLEDLPIKDLKGAVLSLEWEITDNIILSFNDEINRLRETWKGDKILLMFLRLLDAVGKYIRTRKEKAHPSSIELLHSVYDSLEKVILAKGMSEKEKMRILHAEVKKFNELKEQVALAKADPPEKVAVPSLEAIEIVSDTPATDAVDLENISATSSEDSPIKALKDIVLSFDSEITDNIIYSFGEEINRLRDTWKGDKVLLMFLRLLDAVGKYIRTRKEKAHPGSIELLHSVYDSLEKVILAKGMPEKEKMAIFRAEFNKFNEIKEQIAEAKTVVPSRIAEGQTETTIPDSLKDGQVIKGCDVTPSLTASDIMVDDDKVIEEEQLDLGEAVIEDEDTVSLMTASDIMVDDDNVIEEEQLDLGEAVIEDEDTVSLMTASDIMVDDDNVIEEEQLDLGEAVIEDEDTVSLMTASDIMVDDDNVIEEEVSTSKAKTKKRSWFSRKRKNDKDSHEDMETQPEDDVLIDGRQLDLGEAVIEDEDTVSLMTASDIMVDDGKVVEEEVPTSKVKTKKRSWFSRKRKNDKDSHEDMEVLALATQEEGMGGQEAVNEEDLGSPDRIIPDTLAAHDTLEEREADRIEEFVEKDHVVPEMIAQDRLGKGDGYVEEAGEPLHHTEQVSCSVEGSETSSYEAFAFALEDLKDTIKTEFTFLREELKLWREGN